VLVGHRHSRSFWLALAVALYGVSLLLPAVEHEGETVWLGARAALVAVFIPALWAVPLGFLLGLLYPLLGLTLIGIVARRAFATGAAIALVATMALWGFSLPPTPQPNIFGGTHPGGNLGPGFWLWLASGSCLLFASLEPREQQRFSRSTLAGLVYAAVVALSALVLGASHERVRRSADAERRAVEDEKREAIRQASPKSSE
jgi:hypothetical protein